MLTTALWKEGAQGAEGRHPRTPEKLFKILKNFKESGINFQKSDSVPRSTVRGQGRIDTEDKP